MTTAQELAEQTAKIVSTDRRATYGSPLVNFSNIAAFWNVYLHSKYGQSAQITAEDVGNMMTLMKVARTATGKGSIDTYLDIAGYGVCTGEIFAQIQNEKKDGSSS